MNKKIVSVIGGRVCSSEVEEIAHKLGKKLAKVADYLVSDGLSGTMKAVSKGFKAAGGVTIGILPGYSKTQPAEHSYTYHARKRNSQGIHTFIS